MNKACIIIIMLIFSLEIHANSEIYEYKIEKKEQTIYKDYKKKIKIYGKKIKTNAKKTWTYTKNKLKGNTVSLDTEKLYIRENKSTSELYATGLTFGYKYSKKNMFKMSLYEGISINNDTKHYENNDYRLKGMAYFRNEHVYSLSNNIDLNINIGINYLNLETSSRESIKKWSPAFGLGVKYRYSNDKTWFIDYNKYLKVNNLTIDGLVFGFEYKF
jgi:hypothetical protein